MAQCSGWETVSEPLPKTELSREDPPEEKLTQA
jgi:hypothetical protein